MKLYNSYSQKAEEFIPVDNNAVKMYVCGPTVYDYAHLGHARCYITWDVLYRYLKFKGYNVIYCRNVTDVDDKILKKAQQENKTPDEIAQFYYKAFSESMKKLNVCSPDIEPFATKTLGEMILINKQLIEKGHAYQAGGDVYFRVKSFDKYGQLSKQPLEALESGARVEESNLKENSMDFALWKKDEKFGYNSPWGTGRPGWHIECSAMARKHLGKTIDIHAGGADLIFPHHENEIAQSECANGQQFTKYWLHNGFVTINKEKMSKSLGNFLTIDKILETYDANTIRFFILTNHYRMPVEFSDEALTSAAAGVKRLYTAINEACKVTKIDENLDLKVFEEYQEFIEAMDDDLNTSKVLAVLFDLANKTNKEQNSKNLTLFYKISEVLGFNFNKVEICEEELKEKIDIMSKKLDVNFQNMEEFLIFRNKARSEKNWDLADKIRLAFDETGIVLKDSKSGTTWELKN
jgi:cysteinyl-tRNA synthetase